MQGFSLPLAYGFGDFIIALDLIEQFIKLRNGGHAF
jgi:hypothetical protein